MRFAGTKCRCPRDTIKFSYNTYIYTVLKYGCEVLISAA